MFKNLNLDKTNQFLLIILAFLMPLTVFGANIIVVVICLLWLFSGDYKSKYNQIISNKFILVSILFFFAHVIGLLWTEDLRWGLHIVHKMWYFLLFLPVLFTLVKKDYIKFYTQDSLVFLSEFNTRIDLLYLDSLDGHNPVAASNHQLREAKIAIKKLHDKSLILLDDKGSKTNLSIDFLLKNSFKTVFESDYQVLLSK